MTGRVPFNLEGEETVILRVEDQERESDTQEFEITIRSEESITLQTAMTPNGDGLNDTWRIEPIIGCQECRVQIYNRWGEQIFLSIGYEQEWDGTFGGTELPSGTYYYVIDTNDGQEPLTGTITILK